MSDKIVTCKACGTDKPQEEFYKTSAGKYYPYCKDCWSIDMRRRTLQRKADASKGRLTPEEWLELDNIRQLYERRRAAGLQNPGDAKSAPIDTKSLVAKQLERFNNE